MSQMLKSSGGLAAATMASRITGLAREMAYAWFMGASSIAGTFMLAFMIPNLFRRLLGEGALTAAFIPIFKESERTRGETAMWRDANAVLSGLIASLSVLVIAAMVAITLAMAWFPFEGRTLLMLSLLRLMFPYVLLVCVAALAMGMLNSRGHFFIPALGSTVLNLVLIASVFLLAPWFGARPEQQVKGLAVGVLVAGLGQAAFQWPLLRREGFRYRWTPPWRDPTVRTVVRQMLPGILGVAAYQINVLLTNGIAWLVNAEIVASFVYAVRLMELPQGVFGLSMATYLLPTLSGLAADKEFGAFRQTLGQGLGYLILINLLASVLLWTLAEPMVRLLFERGNFDHYATSRAALALRWLAPGLVGFSVVNILARAFYALGDLKTPMRIGVFCLGLNVILVALFIATWREAAMGGANSATALLNMALLVYALRRKLGRLELGPLLGQAPGLAGAAAVAGAVAHFSWTFWVQHFGHQSFASRLGEVFAPMILATAAYFATALLLQLAVAKEFLNFVLRRRRVSERGPGA